MNPYRLPRSVIPARYDLRLEPDLAAARFEGSVRIAVAVREPVAEIVLNAAELEIYTALVTAGTGGTMPAAVTLDADTERCRLHLSSSIAPGDYVVHLTFSGTLNDKLRGFYRSHYRGADGGPRWLAATQFEATDARRCFPCWDEPDFKAVFAATLALDPALQAVSNTRIVEEQLENGRKVVRFADTMKMSTYLVAFVAGELEAGEPVPAGSTQLRVWCVPGKRRLTCFGRDIGAASLAFYEKYYGRNYPGDKLDLLAIPDFAAGAMENLGAITFRETALLVDEASATHAERERVADVVAHENAHMWFGRSRDHVVVERPVVERGLRHLHADAGGRRLEARMAALDDVWRVALVGPDHRRPAEHADHRVPRRGAARRRRDVRHADLRKGRVGAADAGAIRRPRGVPRRRPPLSRSPRLRLHGDRRPVAGPRRGVRAAPAGSDGCLGLHPRLSDRQCPG